MSYLKKLKAASEKNPKAPQEPRLSGVAGADLERWQNHQQALGSALERAITRLSAMCPLDLLTKLDRSLLNEKKRLDGIRLDSVEAIDKWEDGWRILIAEVLIDGSRGTSEFSSAEYSRQKENPTAKQERSWKKE